VAQNVVNITPTSTSTPTVVRGNRRRSDSKCKTSLIQALISRCSIIYRVLKLFIRRLKNPQEKSSGLYVDQSQSSQYCAPSLTCVFLKNALLFKIYVRCPSLDLSLNFCSIFVLLQNILYIRFLTGKIGECAMICVFFFLYLVSCLLYLIPCIHMVKK